MSYEVLVMLVVLALAFDFMNGFHDAANSIATIVSTRVLRPQYAVAWAAFFNFIAFLVFGLNVANTVGKGIIDPLVADHVVVFGALVGAIAWNVITWWFGIPSSSSHALIGGLAGAALAKAGFGALVASGFFKTAVAIVAIADARTLPRRRPDDRGVVGLPAPDAEACRSLVPPTAARLGEPLQPRPRRQRRAEDDGHHRHAAVLGGHERPGIPRAAVGGADLPGGDGARHPVRRLAHREDDGPAHHQAAACRRLLRRDGRRDHALPRHRPRHPGVDDAHDHRCHRRRRLGAQHCRGALGRRRQHRAGPGC